MVMDSPHFPPLHQTAFFCGLQAISICSKNCESSIYGIVAAAMSSPSDLTHRLDGQGGSRREGVGEEGYPYLIAEYLLSVCPSNVNLPTPSLLMADVRSLLGGLNPVAVSEGIFDDQSIKCFGAATYDFFFSNKVDARFVRSHSNSYGV